MVRTPSASRSASCRRSIHSVQSSPPITFTVAASSSGVHGSIVASVTAPLRRSIVLPVYVASTGFSTLVQTVSLSGSCRRGEARL